MFSVKFTMASVCKLDDANRWHCGKFFDQKIPTCTTGRQILLPDLS